MTEYLGDLGISIDDEVKIINIFYIWDKESGSGAYGYLILHDIQLASPTISATAGSQRISMQFISRWIHSNMTLGIELPRLCAFKHVDIDTAPGEKNA